MTLFSTRKKLPFINFAHLCIIIATLTASCQLKGDSEPDADDSKIAYIGCLSHQFVKARNKDATIAVELLYKEITGRLGYKAELVIMEDQSQLRAALHANKVHTVFANPIDYLELDSEINPDFRYTYVFDGSPEQRILLITQAKSKITRLAQLQGKRLSITDGDLLSSTYLEVFLAKAGLPRPNRFFSDIRSTSNNNAAILNLFFNQADLAVTTDFAYKLATELNPQLQEKIEILAISDPYIPLVIGSSKQIPQPLLYATDDILLNLKEDPKLNYILSFFKATDIIKIRSEQLDTLRILKREYDQLIIGQH